MYMSWINTFFYSDEILAHKTLHRVHGISQRTRWDLDTVFFCVCFFFMFRCTEQKASDYIVALWVSLPLCTQPDNLTFCCLLCFFWYTMDSILGQCQSLDFGYHIHIEDSIPCNHGNQDNECLFVARIHQQCYYYWIFQLNVIWMLGKCQMQNVSTSHRNRLNDVNTYRLLVFEIY